ncbi:MAG: hypothetical protein ACHQYQ_11860 [Bacteriovoracales bacterium]
MKNVLLTLVLASAFSTTAFSRDRSHGQEDSERVLNYAGSLKVEQSMNFEKGRRRGIEIPEGDFFATIETWSLMKKPGLTLTFDFTDSEGKTKHNVIRFKGDEKKMELIPATEGTRSYPASKMNQPFDINLDFKTIEVRGESENGTDSCVVRVEYTESCNDTTGCIQIPNPIMGSRDVTYHNETHTTTATIGFVSPERDGGKGTFVGTRVRTEKIYDYQGPCKEY